MRRLRFSISHGLLVVAIIAALLALWVVQFNESFVLNGAETYAHESVFSVIVLMDGRVAISKKPSPRGPIWVELEFMTLE